MPTGVYPRPAANKRFLAKVDIDFETGCWPWRGGTTLHGYGVFWLGGRLVHAHRAALLLAGVDLAGFEDVDHLCRNRLCVNRSHLEPVSHLENVRRGLPFRQQQLTTACHRGHERTPENTYVRPDGFAQCKPCQREAQRRYEQRRSAA